LLWGTPPQFHFKKKSKFILDDLKGILLVSRLIMSIGSGLPMGPKHDMPDWSANGMTTLFLRFWEEEEKRAEVRRCKK
jgi:hypothetical protein